LSVIIAMIGLLALIVMLSKYVALKSALEAKYFAVG
jgi:hypothetical protein